MNRRYHIGFLSIGLLGFLAAATPKKDELSAIFKQINQEVLANGQAYDALREATETVGHRLTGSPNGQHAEQFAYQLLKSYGYNNVAYQPFEVEAWGRSKVSLAIVPENSDNFIDVEVVALAHSPVSSHLKARIVDCGDGLEADFQQVQENLKGKIALFNINVQQPENKGKQNLHRSEKTALAIKYGAAGVIIANSVQGGVLLTGTASVTGELIPIPAVCVSVETGRMIRKWIKDEEKILGVLDMQNFSRPIKARNVIATIPGRDCRLKREAIVVGGHLDSWDLATGAMDNGIGSFSVIEMARVFKKLNLRPRRTIHFVLFMGEEQGLLGSRHMVKTWKKEGTLDRVRLMMNLDMVNNAQGFNAGGNDLLKAFVESTNAQIKQTDSTYKGYVSSRAGLHSDNQPFMLEGIATMSPSGSFPIKALNCYHANCDRFELINRDQLNNNVRYTAMMLYALANDKKLQLPKAMADEELKSFLTKQELKEALIIGKDWRWDN